MKTDKQIHALLASSPAAFRFLTDGIELPGPYQGRSVAFKEQAPAAWRRLETLTEPGAPALLDVFMSWLMERHKGKTYAEILAMLHVLTPLEETRAYRELVGIGIEKGKNEGLKEGLKEGKEKGEKLGRQKEALTILTKLIRRRFGALPRWASARLRQADAGQLEAWAERIFDAQDLTDLLGPKPD